VGDADLKGEGVSADAEVAELALAGGDAFLVLATDGVWDQLSSGDAVGLVVDTVKQPAMCAQVRRTAGMVGWRAGGMRWLHCSGGWWCCPWPGVAQTFVWVAAAWPQHSSPGVGSVRTRVGPCWRLADAPCAQVSPCGSTISLSCHARALSSVSQLCPTP
jgi:hypothetical protein